MEYFPLFLRLAGRKVLIVGGGEVAARKLRLLERSGAELHIVAPTLCPELSEKVAAGLHQWSAQAYAPGHISADMALVVAATDSTACNHAVAEHATALGVWVNVVDDPAPSTAITPAIIDRSPLLVAISSGGAAPGEAKRAST